MRAVPGGQGAQGAQPDADRLGARAQPLVRQGLPGREGQHARIRQVGAEGIRDGVGLTAGRRDREQRLGLAARVEQAGQQRDAEPLDEREVGVAPGVAKGLLEGVGVRQLGNHALEAHSLECSCARDGSPGVRRAV